MRRILLVTTLGLLAVSPAAAQNPAKGTWEIGGFGRYNFYDSKFKVVDSTKSDNSWGAGGRIGYFFAPKWALELDGSFNATDMSGDVFQSVSLQYMPFHLRALYNAPLSSKFQWLIGPSIGYNKYYISDTTAPAFTPAPNVSAGGDFSIGALTGFRWMAADWLSFRVDGTFDFMPSAKAPFVDATADQSGSATVMGLQAGVGLMLGGKCKDKIDSIRVEPRSQDIFIGDQANLRVNGYRCDGQVVDLSGTSLAKALAGGGTLAGLAFTGTQAGCYDVEVSNATARKKGTDVAKICVKERPKPVVTLDRCELVPSNSTVYPGGTVDYKVTGYYSDGTSRDLPEATLNANGGTVTGRTYKAPAAGTYTVTAQCGSGKMATAAVTVRSINLTVRAMFEFGKARIVDKAELDSLRWLADQLKQFPNLDLTINGHTDWVGSTKYNEALGAKRIKAVVDTLVSFGVDRARADAWTKVSYGECQPIVDNKTKAGRAQNRRVSIYDTPSAKQYPADANKCKNKP
jgi:outer membrane protein OmpA-like peptidoglycan-associated protein